MRSHLALALLFSAFLSLLPGRESAAAPNTWELFPEEPFTGGQVLTISPLDHRAYLTNVDGAAGLAGRIYSTSLDSAGLDWVEATVNRPASIAASHMFFDRGRGSFVVFAERWSDTDPLSTTWTWNPVTDAWAQLAPAGSPPSLMVPLQRAVQDTRRNRILFFTGITDTLVTTAFNLDPAAPSWEPLATTGAPGFRAMYAAAYDSTRDRIVILGGQTPLGGQSYEVWYLDSSSGAWTLDPLPFYSDCGAWLGPCPGGSPWLLIDAGFDAYVASDGIHRGVKRRGLEPPGAWVGLPIVGVPRLEPSWAWALDPLTNEIVLPETPAGAGSLSIFRRTPSGGEWRTIFRAGRPTAGTGYAGAIDAEGRVGYILRGRTVHRFDVDAPTRFERLEPPGGGPTALSGQVAAWDSIGGRILVAGGTDAVGAAVHETWALSTDADPVWSELPTTGAIPAGGRQSAAFDAEHRRWLLLDESQGLFELDLTTVPAVWRPLLTPLLLPELQGVGYDAEGSQLLVASATTGLPGSSTAFAIDLSVDPPLPGPSMPFYPKALDGVSIVMDPIRRQLVLHRGRYIDYGCNSCGPGPANQTVAFRSSAGPQVVDLGTGNLLATPSYSSLLLADTRRDRMLLIDGADQLAVYSLQFDQTTPVRLDLIDAALENGSAIRVRLAGEGASGDVRVERMAGREDWVEIGVAAEGTPGLYEYVDRAVSPGASYRYRGRWFADGVEHTTAASAPITVPGGAAAALQLRARAGLVARTWPVEFDVQLAASAGAATLELIDVAGRVVARRSIDASGMVALKPASARAGIYFARLRQGADAVTLRVVRL